MGQPNENNPQNTLSLAHGLEPVQSLYDENTKSKPCTLVPTNFPFVSLLSPYECIDKNTMSKEYNTSKTYTLTTMSQ